MRHEIEISESRPASRHYAALHRADCACGFAVSSQPLDVIERASAAHIARRS